MLELIEALQLLAKYETPAFPTGCEHDILRVYISPDKVSDEDKKKLAELGFEADEDLDCFYSYKFGSA